MYNDKLVYKVVIWAFLGISLWKENVGLIGGSKKAATEFSSMLNCSNCKHGKSMKCKWCGSSDFYYPPGGMTCHLYTPYHHFIQTAPSPMPITCPWPPVGRFSHELHDYQVMKKWLILMVLPLLICELSFLMFCTWTNCSTLIATISTK